MGKIQKNDKFKKITAARVNKINDMLRLVGNCANKNNYSYCKSEVLEIFDSIEKKLNEAKKKYEFFNEENLTNSFKNKFEKEYTWIAGFMRNVIRFPKKNAVIYPKTGEIWNYEELNSEVNRLANALLNFGVKKGDKVLYQMNNCPEFIFIYVACQKIGAIGCPIHMNLSPAYIASIIDCTKPALIIYDHNGDTELAITMTSYKPIVPVIINFPENKRMLDRHITYEKFTENSTDTEPDVGEVLSIYDETTVFHTSGTTGKPKYVPVTSINEVLSAHDVIMQLSIKYSDRLLNLNAWPHRGSLHTAGPSTALYAGCTIIIMEAFDPSLCLEYIERYKVTFASCTPIELKALADSQEKEDRNLSTLHGIVSTGSFLINEENIRYRRLLSPNIFNGYGTTETFWNTILAPEISHFFPDTVGMSCVDDDVRIVRVYDDHDAEPDELVARDGNTPGEIIIKSLSKSSGFYSNSEGFGSHYYKGYLYTKDIGTWNENGIITVVGRNDDMIIRDGEKIYMTEIEEFLNSYSKVEDCIVTSVTAENGKEEIAAYIVKADKTLEIDELNKYCKSSTAITINKIPRFYRFKKVLPKTPNGKKQRKKAAQMAANDLRNKMFYVAK